MRFTGPWLSFVGVATLCFLTISSPLFAAEEGNAAFPFFPSLINTATGEPVASTEFYSPSKCRGCHAEIFKQWKGSMHSNAAKDPIFLAMWELGSDETDGATDKLCAGCHTGVGTVSEEVVRGDDGKFTMGEVALEGVQCHLCHSIVEGTRDGTNMRVPHNASFIVDPGLTMRGPYDDAKPMWHKAAFSELHTSAEFCGNCHNVFHPGNGFHIENTYTEWQFSIYAQKGIVCQDCHMMPVEKAIEVARTLEKPQNPGKASPMGPDRDNVFTHEFVGANFTVTKLMGADNHSEIAIARLKSAAELELEVPEKATGGALVQLDVRVRNVGAGHNLPTSLTEVRQMWLAVAVTDETGKVLYSSGALDEELNLPDGTVIFNSEAVDSDGKHTEKPWKIERFTYTNTIPPKGYADRSFPFVAPEDYKGKLTVEVKLRYRGYPQKLANMLLGSAAPVLPIVDMALITKSIEID